MGAISGPAIYGATRGLGDAERQGMEAEGFQTDQAIRRQRLQQEQELQPLRVRALNREGDLADLNVDLTKLSLEERRDLATRAAKARKEEDILQEGLREMYLSGDPNHVVKALQSIDPEKYRGASAEADYNDGSITFSGPQGKPLTFRTVKDPNTGQDVPPEEQIAHMALRILNPVEHLRTELATRQKATIEGMKQSGATEREYARDLSRENVAELRARRSESRAQERENERTLAAERRALPRHVDRILRTKSESGTFISGYAHEDDAELTGTIRKTARALLEQNKEDAATGRYTGEDAALEATNEVRRTYDQSKGKALPAAQALAKKKIDPRDIKAVGEAAKKGDRDAIALVRAMQEVQKSLGEGVAKYLTTQLPAR